MTKLPQQLNVVQTPPVHQQVLCCEFCGGDHVSGHCSMHIHRPEEEVQYVNNPPHQGNFPNNPPFNNQFSQGWRGNQNQNHNFGWRQEAGPSNRQPPYQSSYQQGQHPPLHERQTKLEETLEKFMQVSISNQKNTDASIRNLETQVGQLAKQMANQNADRQKFSANTQTNPKEHCKSITTRSGKVIGKSIGENLAVEQEVLRGNEVGTSEKVNRDIHKGKEVEHEEVVEQEVLRGNEVGTSKKVNRDIHKGKEVEHEEGDTTNTVTRENDDAKKTELPQLKDLPYPKRPSKKDKERQYARFLDLFKNLQINIPFMEAMEQRPVYDKFMKDLLTKKRKMSEETVTLEAGCSAIIQKSLPEKTKDPGSFTIPVTIGELSVGKALLDLGASINLMPLSMLRRIGDLEIKPTRMTLQLADRSVKYPYGVAEDVLVKVDGLVFPVDFVIMDIEEDKEVPLILGRPFMKTARVIIDVDDGKLKVRVEDQEVNFNVFEAMQHPRDKQHCFRVDVRVDASRKVASDQSHVEKLGKDQSSEVPKVELKQLLVHLKYVFLEEGDQKPVIINNTLSSAEEQQVIEVLKKNAGAIGWTLADLHGISPSYCMHKIHMEDDYKLVAQPQRRLNPTMKEVAKKEVIKLLDVGMIYPISDSKWVSPVQVVPKKGGMTVIRNEKDELIPTRTVTGWRMCIDYRKLNQATRKDHFPLPFMDQMIERLAGQAYYCFLDGYSSYNQITVDPQDQEKTTFTCPFGIFAYRKMPFGLCNAPTTFQRCMLAIFSDLVEQCIEVFMDDFSIFGSSFENCLANLDIVLQRCVETNLVLNWEKCHCMVTEGVVLGHKISSRGIEVDKAKIEVIKDLPPPLNVKGIRSFLGHAGFYRRFIKDFSKIVKPLMVIYTDHAAIKYLLTKSDSKPRLLRWVLLLEEFDLVIKDKKGSENCVADHLSRLVNQKVTEKESEEVEEFLDEKLLSIQERTWFADMANFKAAWVLPEEFTWHQKRKFLRDSRQFVWDDPHLFKTGSD
ncbi:PREDICTED: uncharacterized protein LOC109361886 [Lupinus angustifolius]|uniref:uncharacterized protein LOC109361886 n=1 Tax=Lupinus angustifolius TaxID=3871 RepID=UPI00092E4F54|nr:PREDICTED: uncharacterized protein LOC109361886 [Lupinus angustifolius]